jgi:hypothetical protein
MLMVKPLRDRKQEGNVVGRSGGSPKEQTNQED